MLYGILINPDNKIELEQVLERLDWMGLKMATGISTVEFMRNKKDDDVGALIVDGDEMKVYFVRYENVLTVIYDPDIKKHAVIPAELFLYLTYSVKTGVTNKNVKVGDTIRIMTDYSYHGFKIGSAAIVLKVNRKDAGTVLAFGYCEKTGRCGKRHVDPRDYEVVEDDE